MNRIKNLIKRGLSIILRIIIHVLPRDKNIVAFGAWSGNKYIDNPKYLYEHMLKSKKYKIYWITRDIHIYNNLKEKDKPVLMINSLKGKYITLRAKHIVTCTGLSDVSLILSSGAVSINLWHGIPLKKIQHDNKGYNNDKNKLRIKFNESMNKRYVFSTSPYVRDIYKGAFNLPSSNVIQLGQPRNDIFYNRRIIESNSELATIKGNKKLILYMPTHRNFGEIEFDFKTILELEFINSVCKENNYLFIIKKHYHHQSETMDLTSYENIIDITNLEIDPQILLLESNILITDYSSCFIDYLLMDRPIIFYCYDLERYLLNDRDMYMDYNDINAGAKAKTVSELSSVIKGVIQGNDDYSIERNKLKDLYFSKEVQKEVSPLIEEFLINLNEGEN